MKQKQFLSDILKDAHRQWRPGSKVFISAHPGAGKTTYILRVLLKYAIDTHREILFLSNRDALHKQLLRAVCNMFNLPFECFEKEKFAEFPGITLSTYQTVAEMLASDKLYSNLPFFHYVVFDECHFFADDSDFNAKIQRLLCWKERIQCDVEIYISATLEDILIEFGYWNNEWITVYEDNILEICERMAHDIVRRLKGENEYLFFYHIPFEFPQCNVYVYDDIADIVELINRDKTEEKWVLFQSNKDTARRIATKDIKTSVAIITADDKGCNAMREIVENQCFEEKVLITTKVLDNGVSLHDKKIRNILIETTSKTEFVQMLGRRRIENNEEVVLNLYIPRLHTRYFQSMIIRRIQPLLELTMLSQAKLLSMMMDSFAGYKDVKTLYDAREGRLVLNPIAEKRLREKKGFFEKMALMLEDDENCFVKEQMSWIGLNDISKVKFISEMMFEKMQGKLISVLEEFKDKELSKAEQKLVRTTLRAVLKELFPEKFPHTTRIPGLNVINDCLEELKLPYRIRTFSQKRKGGETKWKIEECGLAT